MAVRNTTQWTPPSGTGYVVTIGNEDLVTNSGLFITDNLGNFIVTTPTYDIPKYKTSWTQSSKNDTGWTNKTATVSTSYTLADSSSNSLVDASGNTLVDNGEVLSGKSPTVWTLSGV